MKSVGIVHRKLDLNFSNDVGEVLHYKVQNIGKNDTNIFCMPITDLWKLYFEDPSLFYGNNKKIAIIQWELENYDEDIIYILNVFEQVYTISDFIKRGLIKYCEKITTIPLPFLDRNISPDFNFKDFLNFYFIFDTDSFISRKNPYDVIKAFQIAFVNDEPVRLYIKINKNNKMNLVKMMSTDSRIIFISEYYDNIEYSNFINNMHVFVSLHRAEGFGRSIAEAILNHKIVIASNYGGVVDYLNKHNCFLINGEIKQIPEWEYFFFENNKWFYPDIKEASKVMLLIYNMVISRKIKFNFKKNKKIFLNKYSVNKVGKFIEKIL